MVKEFRSYCGWLPAPESFDNPLGYKFSGVGVLLNLALYHANVQQVDMN